MKKTEQNNREGDNTECVRCVNGINKEFIQIDSFLITHNRASSLLRAELKTKTAAWQHASLCVFLNFLPSGKKKLINKMKGNSWQNRFTMVLAVKTVSTQFRIPHLLRLLLKQMIT